MNCPHCNSSHVVGNGHTKAGTPRYRCKDCKKSWSSGKPGRKLIGDRVMTSTERWRKWRDKNKQE